MTEQICTCGVVLGTTAEDDEGEMSILYRRCPIHEVDETGSWFAESERDLYGYQLTRDGRKFLRELETNKQGGLK